jgi:hypothetical protein
VTRCFAVGALLGLAACEPDLGERRSILTETRILAVRGDPPEARPGEEVRYAMLVASPSGPVPSAVASWAHCATPKSLLENGAASRACLADGVRPFGVGKGVTAAIPADACSLFGSEVASAEQRPRDPDVSGGFYQPVRVMVEGAAPAFGLQRVRCSYASINGDIANAYAQGYVPNRNPDLEPLEASIEGRSIALTSLPPGARVVLRLGWAETETYLLYDPNARALTTRRETMRASWFATAGSFTADRTGRAAEEPERWTENTWSAPDTIGTVHLFTVLRDDRGGVAFAAHELAVRR